MSLIELDLQNIAEELTGEKIELQGYVDESNLYIIKLPNILRPHFEQVFQKIDDAIGDEKYNIKSYNVRVTSLEEVFNKIGEEDNKSTTIDTKTEGNEIVSNVKIERIAPSNT